ncbi:MAG TPA: cobyric acid synthase [Acidimicrobiales bacterium]|nr:cobyric acid synthase [Acidimicrobiales bacterium]
MRGALMVCGTTSNAGKSTIVAGLCRLYARRGLRVAPFKAQNMANNSAVTRSGHEIGRAQAWQADAAGTVAEAAMNPILLKPTGPGTSQVVVLGRPVATMTAREYHAAKPQLFATVLDALADLRSRFDVVVLEGAGSPAEINLLDHDIVNLRVAAAAGVPAVVVGDIDLGGVFAALYGTVALLPDELRRCVQGFVVNRFRGDPSLLAGAGADLEARCGVPTLGVVPMLPGDGLDGEDSLTFDRGVAGVDAALLDVAVVRLPHLANSTDLDPLRVQPDVALRWVSDRREVGHPDLLVVPGSKATVADLAWLRSRGLDRSVAECPTTVLGICAGYQMLGSRIDDPSGVESTSPSTPGLGLLPAVTRFEGEKVTRRQAGSFRGAPVRGYQIHHGRVDAAAPALLELDGRPEGAIGATAAGGAVWGTTLHGLLDDDAGRAALLGDVAARAGRPAPVAASFEAARQARVDAIADALESALDVEALDALVATGARR